MIQFLLLGLGTGAIYALVGQGMVLVYRGSGVLNFAQGAFAAVGALAFYQLHVSSGVATPLAFTLALLITAAAGLLMQLLVMRPLRDAPPLTRVIATLGVMVGLQQAAYLIFGSGTRTVSSILPTKSVKIAGTAVGEDRLLLLLIALVVSSALWAVYRFTRFGAITTAVAENERAAQLVGHSPDRIAGINWVLGAVLAGAAGILVAPIIGLDINALVLLIIPALATGVVAGFGSFVAAFIASLVIGVLQSEITKYVTASGWGAAVPFLLVILVLVVRGQSLPLRSHVNERLPEIGTGTLRPRWIIVGTAVALLLIFGTPDSWADALTTTIIGAIICVSLVVVTGYTGQLSLAQYAFAGWGGYVATRLAATQGWPFLVVLVIGVVAAIPVGVLVGLPALRARGINLAIATFGLAYSLQSVLFQSTDLTGGLTGTVVASPTVFGWNVDSSLHPKRYAMVSLVALILTAVVAANIRRGRVGRRLVAVRGNERAAASLGINLYSAKLYSFAVSGAMAGLAGVLLAFRSTYVDFGQFNVFSSIAVVINTVIGGVGYLVGGLIAGMSSSGGVTSKIFGEIFTSPSINQYISLALALLLVPTLVGFPNGLAAFVVERFSRVARRSARTSTTHAAAAPTIERVKPRTLEVRSASVSFGGVRALSGVSLEVRPGEIVGLMGPNGAGKTTLIDAVTGFTRLKEGSIHLDGVRIDGEGAHRRARAGLARTFQSLELFDQLSVMENLRSASDPRDGLSYLTDLVRPKASALTPGARTAISMFDLLADLDRSPAELPYGRRRQVAIARAVAAEPSILLLDEPAAGLHESETVELGRLLRRLAEEWGIGILLVEHDVPLLNRVCDRLVVMDFGAVIAEGAPDAVRNDPAVIAAYLGVSLDEDQEAVIDVR